jgi:hypothetical protein
MHASAIGTQASPTALRRTTRSWNVASMTRRCMAWISSERRIRRATAELSVLDDRLLADNLSQHRRSHPHRSGRAQGGSRRLTCFCLAATTPCFRCARASRFRTWRKSCMRAPFKKIARDINEDARNHARSLKGTPEFERPSNARKSRDAFCTSEGQAWL